MDLCMVKTAEPLDAQMCVLGEVVGMVCFHFDERADLTG
jgi:hypothetical protein